MQLLSVHLEEFHSWRPQKYRREELTGNVKRVDLVEITVGVLPGRRHANEEHNGPIVKCLCRTYSMSKVQSRVLSLVLTHEFIICKADSGSGARIPYTRSGKYSRQSFTQTRTLNSNGKSAKILWLHYTLPMGSLVCDLKFAGAEFSSDLRSK
ncbi:hypothetical protein CDAR_294951 [Caerostris darwini]|uniref:Uncharacterized protein n=1 Tax=Caerostris darwini TaxID=1538125 RepID=A0AAV4UK91_9ARAC|nr:hypothetical protein CDAR_294951 [Caerostris darwini]